jgi:cell pole-organizing protein PopZ
MSQPAKAQEPSMEEILASIRRIIADDDSGKAPAKPAAAPPREAAAPPPMPAVPNPPPSTNMNQRDVDAVMAGFDSPPPAPESAPRDDILELTEEMAAPPPEPAAFQTIDGHPDVVFADAPPEPPPRQPAPHAPPPLPNTPPPLPSAPAGPALLSSATSAAVDSAFNTLAQTVLVQNARTLEDLVREMLRPMLKSWLDDNLPGIVERIVRAEIERVSRGRG